MSEPLKLESISFVNSLSLPALIINSKTGIVVEESPHTINMFGGSLKEKSIFALVKTDITLSEILKVSTKKKGYTAYCRDMSEVLTLRRINQIDDINNATFQAFLTISKLHSDFSLILIEDVTHCMNAFASMQKASLIDELTGVANRRSLNNHLEEMRQENNANKIPFAILFIDCDNFSTYNIKHGHAYGDQVLQRLGRFMSSSFRPADFIGRYGGDEFVVIVKNMDSAKSLKLIATNLQKRVKSIIATPKISISIGGQIIFKAKSKNNFNKLFQRANKNLFEAKKTKRIIISNDESDLRAKKELI